MSVNPMPIEPITAPAQEGLEKTESGDKPQIRERVWGIDARGDASVSLLEFTYWAKIERAEEVEAERKYREQQGPWTFKKMIKNRFSKGVHHENKKREEAARREQQAQGVLQSADEKGGEKTQVANLDTNQSSSDTSSVTVSEEEWKTAARALRTASWGSVFYLITTDILGWSGCPYVLNSLHPNDSS